MMASENTARRWFALTRDRMPDLARQRGWPVFEDHCFQRILLDNAVGDKWDLEIPAPAYRNASDELLERAMALGEGAIAGTEDLADLNRNSLAWRGKGEPGR
ncbi:GCN5-related N-acetyltransferase [Erythrobacter sp. A6_0]|uniref:GCN5-related N-acetyltransferase n=1 Tax=Erythrobacter sp. A6_0 TaxID=2821089 RepID=UPI001FD72C84|nr:GCN5-related N-acetyltransferase [Erythrobacter sp. A6_0]